MYDEAFLPFVHETDRQRARHSSPRRNDGPAHCAGRGSERRHAGTGARAFEVAGGDLSAGSLPFPDGVFDKVRCDRHLEESPCLRRSLKELLRVLRPGGSLTVTVLALSGEDPADYIVQRRSQRQGLRLVRVAELRRALHDLSAPGTLSLREAVSEDAVRAGRQLAKQLATPVPRLIEVEFTVTLPTRVERPE